MIWCELENVSRQELINAHNSYGGAFPAAPTASDWNRAANRWTARYRHCSAYPTYDDPNPGTAQVMVIRGATWIDMPEGEVAAHAGQGSPEICWARGVNGAAYARGYSGAYPNGDRLPHVRGSFLILKGTAHIVSIPHAELVNFEPAFVGLNSPIEVWTRAVVRWARQRAPYDGNHRYQGGFPSYTAGDGANTYGAHCFLQKLPYTVRLIGRDGHTVVAGPRNIEATSRSEAVSYAETWKTQYNWQAIEAYKAGSVQVS